MASNKDIRRLVWERICRHIDGVSIGSTIAALGTRGVFDLLMHQPGLSMRALHRVVSGNKGYLHVALRLLACQGWLLREGESGTDEMSFKLTPAGMHLTALVPFYAGALSFLAKARDLMRSDVNDAASWFTEARARIEAGWNLPRGGTGDLTCRQAQDHLDGHAAAPVMAMLALRGLLPPAYDPNWSIDLQLVNLHWRPLARAFDVLGALGWIRREAATATLTPVGAVAAAYARQYWYPMSYLETYLRVPELLFGERPPLNRKAAGAQEAHVDRALDIEFSGAVFEKSCRRPFLEIALPIFDSEWLSSQPVAVVDMGCGNGSLLRTLYENVRDRTRRGRHFAEYPLRMIGVDPSPVAREAAAASLNEASVPCRILNGDINDPDGLAASLRGLHIDPLRVLHVSKSVIHNRTYFLPITRPDLGARTGNSSNAFAAADGSPIRAIDLGQNLVDLLRRWRDLCRAHGMLVIEAHTASPAVIARSLGRSIATAVDASHGYSNQYLVEPEVFLAAAEEAGFAIRANHAVGEQTVGHTVLTITHLLPTA